MEELTRVTPGMGLVSLGFIAVLVIQPTQIITRCAPIATIVFSEVIAMRESGANRIWVIFGFSQYYRHSVALILSIIPNFFFFLRHTLPALVRVGN